MGYFRVGTAARINFEPVFVYCGDGQTDRLRGGMKDERNSSGTVRLWGAEVKKGGGLL